MCCSAWRPSPRSFQLQYPEGLCVLRADATPLLLRVALKPVLEVAEHAALDLAFVLLQRGDLAFQEAGDVLAVIRPLRPCDPHVVPLPRLEAAGDVLREEVRIACARENRVEGDR